MTTRAEFLAEIEAHLSQTRTSATRFGREAVRDPRFVHDLRKGNRSPSIDMVDRVRTYIRLSAEASEAVE